MESTKSKKKDKLNMLSNDQEKNNASSAVNLKEIAFEYFKKNEEIILDMDYELTLGTENKFKHIFDLGSCDKSVLIKCKSDIWPNDEKTLAEKMSIWNETMFYFNLAPEKYRKIFFVLRDYSEKKRQTLLQYHISKNCKNVTKNIKIYEYNEKNGHCAIFNIYFK